MLNTALMSSAKDDWQTPEVVLDAVRRFAPIVLDPCTTEDNPVGAEFWYTPAVNGLIQPWCRPNWERYGSIFVNPPYGRGIGAWIERCTQDWQRPVIALVPARPDTAWWQQHRPAAVCFWRGRLTFRGAPHPAPFPSALCIWSSVDFMSFVRVMRPYGQVWWGA